MGDRTQIKVCGVTEPGALDAAIKARVEHAGFNFVPTSPRFLQLSQAPGLAARAEGRIGRVGLFVDASDAAMTEAVTAARLDTIQLHGGETPQRAAQVRASFGKPVWKVIPIASAADIERAIAYAGAVDLILFDAKTPKGALPGGLGLAFDWTLLAGWRDRMPWGLAGGLSPETVGEALRISRAPLVDVASGVESAPGVKDPARIAAFAAAVRSAV